MTIPQLVERGIDIIEYNPGVDTPGDDYKKIPDWDKRDKFPSIDARHAVREDRNYAIRPDDRNVDIDFDDGITRALSVAYFNGRIKYGRDGRGHCIQQISNPTSFTRYQIKFDDEVLIELRGDRNVSVCKGKLTDPVGVADLYVPKEEPEVLTYEETRRRVNEIGLITQLVRGFDGSVNTYLIPVAGEMLKSGVPMATTKLVFSRFLSMIGRGEREKETMRSIDKIDPEKYSNLDKLNWNKRNIDAVRNTIRELSERKEEYKKPQRMEWTALSTIIETEYDPLVEIVEGMLTPGLWFLAAKPKLGKSFLTMQLAHAVATGTEFLGRKTIQGSVLFVALEDNARRIKKRAEMCGYDKCKNIHFTFVSPKLMDGLEEQLLQKAKELGDCKLIIIDTFIRAKSSKKKIGGNDSYEEASFLIDKFQRMLIGEDICCMANTHDKKEKESKNDDKVNRMTGSAAYQGQDGTWRLDRRRGGEGIYANTEFTIVARDLPEQEYEIKLEQGTWSMVGVAEKGEEHDKLTRNILQGVQAICDDPDGYGDCKTVELVKWLRDANFVESNPENTKKYKLGDFNVKGKVKSMKKKGLLVLSGGRYAAYKIPEIIPEEPPQQDLPF